MKFEFPRFINAEDPTIGYAAQNSFSKFIALHVENVFHWHLFILKARHSNLSFFFLFAKSHVLHIISHDLGLLTGF